MESRWSIVDPLPCPDAILISEAGDLGFGYEVNGYYCPIDGGFNGRPAWARLGQTFPSIYWEPSGTPHWELRRDGTLIYSNLNGNLRPNPDTWVEEFAPPDLPPVWTKAVEGLTEIHPINGGDVAYTDDSDRSSGQIFFRRKLANALKFGSSAHKDEYDYFWNQFRTWPGNTVGRCGSSIIRHDLKCGNRWRELWRGEFSASGGHYDRKHCTATIKPDPLDRYQCIMRRMDTKYNVLDQDSETLDVPIMSTLEIVITNSDFTGIQDYEEATSIVDSFGCTIYVWWQEAVNVPCVSGSPSAPSTPGWTLRQNFCSSQGYARYTRPPSIAWTFGDPTPGTWGTFVSDEFGGHGEDSIPPDDSCNWVGFQSAVYGVGCWDGETPGEIAYDRLLPYFLCKPVYSIVADTETITRARDFGEALSAMYAPCGGQVVSDFLEINPAGDAPGYVAGTNYVTGEANKAANLKLMQMSDAVSQTSNAAEIGNLTLKEALLFLQSMRLYWDIDDNGDLRIEHWTYWQSVAGFDVTRRRNTEADAFLGLDEKPPRAEICTWAFANGVDFIGKDITYAPPCASEDDSTSKKYDFKPFVTDLPIIIQTRATNFYNITKEGFLVISCEVGDGTVTVENGAITSIAAANMHLSWANLHDNYWRHDRLLPTGNMNGVDVEFDGFVPNIRQDEFSVETCCDIFDFNPRDRVICALSISLERGQSTAGRLAQGHGAYIKRAVFYPSTGWMKLSLLHAYE